ncbi:MAG: DUF5615 family PIN-like protein [Gemmatimonadota bacterium]|nr:DUF5615 family PIN-like protein [Gemmatimonadota bacterium]MDH3368678.1 DUF5615 family PIN-like protein [Gemmatimonadota bacterium]MDH3478856.1 DUF5615 family PIN-like protein [Gemmatimonadota bacterium]MDH5550600.1 DUF5615 family PIN-like protein [Gemmatimonadota bacterium]
MTAPHRLTTPGGVLGHQGQPRRAVRGPRHDWRSALRTCTDRRVLETAHAELRCLVTLDLDFGNPLVFDPATYSGIAVIRLPVRATPGALLEAVRTLLGAVQSRSIVGRLWIVHRNQVQEYHPEP